MKVAVSFLKSKFDNKETIDKINETDSDFLHVDVMDGNFVERKNFSFNEFKEWSKDNKKLLDVHLMVENPINYIFDYKKLKPEYITIHSEIDKNLDDLIDLIHSYNIKAGISIKPKTSIEGIEHILSKIDNVLIMSVDPGKGGQKFNPSVLYKIDVLRKLREENNYNYIISIDGGINNKTIDKVKDVDLVISGSYICESKDYQANINKLR
ncbi:MAG: ribulose-phosphate 3-epimerase [Bacilli bacterium]|nr:ribulose-phosphate 3-epimerase [Bacilli bacterium]